eukprot:gb/GECG01007278.1/.p1 GENE.gb/GECG01007278.1/~~gb/GECG01007278.1/.p1  ORF type:complete len:907 (+),score=116.99 gb/GECG01007278.1/:1-2721(+)
MQRNKMLSWLKRKASNSDRKLSDAGTDVEFIEPSTEDTFNSTGSAEPVHRQVDGGFSSRRTSSVSSAETLNARSRYLHKGIIPPTLEHMADNPMVASNGSSLTSTHRRRKASMSISSTGSGGSPTHKSSTSGDTSENFPGSNADTIRLENRTASGTSLKKDRRNSPKAISVQMRTSSGTTLKKMEEGSSTDSFKNFEGSKEKSPNLLSGAPNLRAPNSAAALVRKYPCALGGSYMGLPSQIILQFLSIDDWKALLQVSKKAACGMLFEFLDPCPTPQSVINASAFTSQCVSWIREIQSAPTKGEKRKYVPIQLLRIHCVSLCCRRGDVGEAKSLLQLQTPNPVGLRFEASPDEHLFAPLLQAARLERKAQVAHEVLQVMKGRHCQADIRFWNSLLAALSSNIAFYKHIPDAIEEMDRTGVKADATTCKLLLQVITAFHTDIPREQRASSTFLAAKRTAKYCSRKLQEVLPKRSQPSVRKKDTEDAKTRRYSTMYGTNAADEDHPSDSKENGSVDEGATQICYINDVPHTVVYTVNPMVKANVDCRETDDVEDEEKLFSTYFQSPWFDSSGVPSYRPLSTIEAVTYGETADEDDDADNSAATQSPLREAANSLENAYFLLPSGIVDSDEVARCPVTPERSVEDAYTSDSVSVQTTTTTTSEFKPINVDNDASLPASVQKIVESAKMSLPSRRNEGLLPTPTVNAAYSNSARRSSYITPQPIEKPEQAHRWSKVSNRSVSSFGTSSRTIQENPREDDDTVAGNCSEYSDPSGRRLSSFSSSHMSTDWIQSSQRSITSYRSSATCSEHDSVDGAMSLHSQASNPRVYDPSFLAQSYSYRSTDGNGFNWMDQRVQNPAVAVAQRTGGLLPPPSPSHRNSMLSPGCPDNQFGPKRSQQSRRRRVSVRNSVY